MISYILFPSHLSFSAPARQFPRRNSFCPCARVRSLTKLFFHMMKKVDAYQHVTHVQLQLQMVILQGFTMYTSLDKLQFQKPDKFVLLERKIMQRNKCIVLVTLPSVILSLLLFIIFFHVQVLKPPPPDASSELSTMNPNKTQFSLMIGILTRADNYDRRHFLRLVYGIQSSPLATIDVKFVFCSLTKPEQRALIALEMLRFDDILILNCTENMNNGKTYTYFSSLPHLLPRNYDYIMKADDDVFIRFEPLALSLKALPRVDLYYGFVIPCASMNPFVEYMSGMGFLLSWDLVEWIGSSKIPKENLVGPEDKLVGKWLKMGNKAKNRFSNKPAMYDYPGTNGRCSHELIPETVAVHRLKRWDQWLRVIEYFNVTKGLKL